MIAAPIGFGYLFASETNTVTYWDTTGNANLSNEILNYETPIYGPYDGPNNNLYLIDLATHERASPDYNEVSDIPTSLPAYDNESRSYTLTAGTSATYTISNGQSVGNTGSGANKILGSQPYQCISIGSADHQGNLTYTIDGTSYSFLLGGTIVALQNGEHYSVYVDCNGYGLSTIHHNVTTWKVIAADTATVTTYVRNYTTLNISTDYLMPIEGASSVQITHSNGTVEYANPYATLTSLLDSNTRISYNAPGFLKITAQGTTTTYSNVSSVAIASYSTNGTVTYEASFPNGLFANASMGWKLPADLVRWYNNFENESVRLMLKLNAGDSFSIYVPGTNAWWTIAKPLGTVTVEGNDLGAYTYVMVDVGMEKLTVSGISEWPAISVNPAIVLNTVTVNYAVPATAPFDYLQFDQEGTPDVRVDKAAVAMGTFPSTKDYVLDVESLYPGKSFVLKFNSIGVYGDTLTYGNNLYVVENGKITVDGTSVSLRGATFTAHKENGEYALYINKTKTETLSVAPLLTFGGEWSLTVTATLQELKNEQRSEWAPGEFAFDREDFAACGILVAGACLVGLGMYGQRSGMKMGLLLLICGGAALAYLTFV